MKKTSKIINLKSLNIQEIEQLMEELSYPKFRGKQIFQWIHNKKVDSIDDMNNIPKNIKEDLKAKTIWDSLEMVKKLTSQKDGTKKYLFALKNGTVIESVFMKYSHGNTVCVSTQAGCRMGCTFCASTINGLDCNLTAGEMLSQVYMIEKETGEKITGVVMMGSGEPLDNYQNSIKFIRLINDPQGQNMGQRHITLSTCGLVDKIYDLSKEKLQITLAISLHAPNDNIRNQTMPIANKYYMEELLQACEEYTISTGRRITFEYALIDNFNDTKEHSTELAIKLRNLLCHVNLIPVNEVKERKYKKSSDNRVGAFATILGKNGIEATVRRKLGDDINGACGQLRLRYLQEKD